MEKTDKQNLKALYLKTERIESNLRKLTFSIEAIDKRLVKHFYEEHSKISEKLKEFKEFIELVNKLSEEREVKPNSSHD